MVIGVLSLSILFKYECSMGHLYVLNWARVRRVDRGSVVSSEWYGVCDFAVLSVVEVCANYVGVNVFHVCLNFGGVYGVGVCVNVCGVVCVVCFLRLGVVCCVVVVWGVVIFVLSVMCVVGGVPLWVVCVFRRVDVVCLCLLCTQLLF